MRGAGLQAKPDTRPLRSVVSARHALALLAVGVVVYSLAFFVFRRAFQALTGGLGFRA